MREKFTRILNKESIGLGDSLDVGIGVDWGGGVRSLVLTLSKVNVEENLDF